MFWFRHRQPTLIRLAIVLWVLAFGLAAGQGCLTHPSQSPATSHASLNTTQEHDSQDARTFGCLQHCADTAIAVSLLHLLMSVLTSWIFLLLPPALLILYLAKPSALAFLALRHPVPARPPARLIFVRFND
ncbi:hypothetical protein D3C76_806130 [compost metagenome]